jgi:hypothetical protein
VVASAQFPVECHFFVMLVQVTLALPFQTGGAGAVPGVAITAAVAWALLLSGMVGVRLVRSGRIQSRWLEPVDHWLARFPLREIAPFLWGFAALAVFDVHIQWLASRAFGVDIEWMAMAARLPLIYLTFLIPTLGNFGTRELTWAALFSEYGERDALIAYAFSINAIFLVLNVVLGILFLSRALELIRAVRQTRRDGGTVPKPLFGDPNDP